MTTTCDFCKKPVKAEDNKPMTLGSKVLDFHKGCDDKFIERIVGAGASNPEPAPSPKPPAAIKPEPLPEKPKKKHWWQSDKTRKVAKNIEKWADDESKEMQDIADKYLKGWGE